MVTLGERLVLIPSVVQVGPDGSLLLGDDGTPSIDEDPSLRSRDFKRRLGDHVPLVLGDQPYSAVPLLAALLRSVLGTIIDLEGDSPDRVVLTCPTAWGPVRREQFAEVARLAGLDPDRVTVLTEAEAVASYYAAEHHLSPGDVLAVYHLGGGNFDAAVVRVSSVAERGTAGVQLIGVPETVEWVGGMDFDEAILAHVDRVLDGAVSALDSRDPFEVITRQRIRIACGQAKEALSEQPVVEIVVSLPDRKARVSLSRSEFESLIAPSLESTTAALKRTLESADVTSEQLAGVLLVGGSARIPMVSPMLSEFLGRPVLVDLQPQHCVALGAAAVAAGRPYSASSGVPAHVPAPRRLGRLLAVSAVVALLVGGGTYAVAAGPLASASSAHTRIAEPAGTAAAVFTPVVPAVVVTPTAGPATPTASPSSPKPTPKPKASKPAKPAKPKAAVSPLMGFTGTVIGPAKKCMDVQNAQPSEGARIQLFACNQSVAQVWNGGSNSSIRAFGKCLTAAGPNAADANLALLRSCDGSAAQKWTMKSGSLHNRGSKLCLDTLESKAADYTPLVTTSCDGGASQHWKLSS
jgi:molecular chaperone DnaK